MGFVLNISFLILKLKAKNINTNKIGLKFACQIVFCGFEKISVINISKFHLLTSIKYKIERNPKKLTIKNTKLLLNK